MKTTKLLLLLILVVMIISYFVFDLNQFFNLEYIKSQQAGILEFYHSNPVQTAAIFFLIYVAVAALSLPGAAIMTLIGGAIFGLALGTLIISFASSIGATLAFLASRFIFRDSVQHKFKQQLTSINNGIEKDGAFYLFGLRLVPAFPFFLINLLMGLTTLNTWTFYWVSQIGMLAGTLVYVNAGTQLGKLDSLSGILSPALLFSFVLLAIFPFIAKALIATLKARKVMKNYQKPKQFDRNLIVIGAGSAGLVTAYIAAAVKARVTLIEKHKMGGDCLYTGCVPSKALIRSAKLMHQARNSSHYGIKSMDVEADFADIMDRVQTVIKTIEPHDSVERYTELGVECIQGEAHITSPYSVEVNGQTLSTRSIVIASGARPFVPDIPGLDTIQYYTSDTIWGLRQLPERLLVLGGGPIGSELVQAFQRLGSQVTQVEMLPRILIREDPEVSETVMQQLTDEGVDVRVNHKASRIITGDRFHQLICEDSSSDQNKEVIIEFDVLLVAVGRIANTTGFGLESLGIPITPKRTIQTNQFLQTLYPNIYTCGDVAGPFQFTHTASHQAWYAAVNALFGDWKKFKVDYSVIPWATFTDPEVARVGFNEAEAREQNIDYEVTRYDIDDLDRAIADGEAHGFVKVLTVPGKDKILGVTIVGEHAGDLIAEFVSAMKNNIGLNKILGTIHIYPTLSEANKYTAGVWKKAHAPQKLLEWVERYHRWRRR
ncbi:MAG: FAD-dependent oxidoreductase [Gammaproteobacteria bacterium]|nr:FAD-dependent oxidoreductase [Gammaproteobacteria bacterium]